MASPGSPPTGKDPQPELRVRCACVTVWVAGKARNVGPFPKTLEQLDDLAAAKNEGTPIWVELDVVADDNSVDWLDPAIKPWTELVTPRIRWEDIGELLALLGATRPDQGGQDIVARTLSGLPFVYTLGVARARSEVQGGEHGQVSLFPAVGFQEPPDEKRLRAWMYRVNVAAVGRYVFTMRLRSLPWPEDARKWLDAVEDALVVRDRFLPTSGQPNAHELAEAIAFHQAATCGAIVALARLWLGDIESKFLQSPQAEAADAVTGSDAPEDAPDDQAPPSYGAEPDPVRDPKRLRADFHELFRLGVRAEQLERELTRLIARFDDREVNSSTGQVKARFAEPLQAVRSLQTDLRLAGDGVASIVASQQFAVAQQQQEVAEAQRVSVERFQRRVTIVGSAVLIPALVASVYGANVELPGEEAPQGLAAMLFFMAGLGVGTWWGISTLEEPAARLTAWPWQTARAHVHAAFFVALVTLAFGVVALTPLVDPALSGADAALAIAGVLLIALGLGITVWCWINGAQKSKSWWDKRPGGARAATAGRVLGPVAVVLGAVLMSAFF